MLLQDAAIVVMLVAPGLAAVYWLRRLPLLSRLAVRRPRQGGADAGSLGPPVARRRRARADAVTCNLAPSPVQVAAPSAERASGLQATAGQQLDAAQYALQRLVLDLQGVLPALQPAPADVVPLAESRRPSKDRALAA